MFNLLYFDVMFFLEVFWVVTDLLTISVLFNITVTVLQLRFEFYFSDSLVSHLD